MESIVWGLSTEWYWVPEMAFSYDNVYILQQGEGEVYILTGQMRAVLRPYQNLGLVSPGWIITSH